MWFQIAVLFSHDNRCRRIWLVLLEAFHVFSMVQYNFGNDNSKHRLVDYTALWWFQRYWILHYHVRRILSTRSGFRKIMHLALEFEKSNLILGSEVTPGSTSGRCLFLVLFLTSLTVYTYYTSVFVSTLVKAGSKNKINSVTDLAKSQLKVGLEDIPYIHGFLNVSSTVHFFINLFDCIHSSKYISSFVVVFREMATLIK